MLKRVAAHKLFSLGTTLQKLIDFVRCTIVNGDTISATLDIERQVFTHDSQADQTKIALFLHDEQSFSHWSDRSIWPTTSSPSTLCINAALWKLAFLWDGPSTLMPWAIYQAGNGGQAF